MTDLPADAAALLDPEALAAAMRSDFPLFFAMVMNELEPGTRYDQNWHVLMLADRLEAVRKGEVRRLMVNQPPRSLKTQMSSIAFCAWVLGQDPTRRIICLTYSQEIARGHAVLFHKVMMSPWYQALFPETRRARHSRLQDWQTTQAGYRLGASVKGGVLSRGADIIIIDDPNKGQEIYSELARQKVHTTYDHTISTRLNNPIESAIILVMQRLHPDDLAGHVLEQEDWEQVVIPATAIEDEDWDLGWGLSHERKKGEVLQPNRMGPEELAVKRKQMGLAMYEAQYQQQPVPQEGLVIKRRSLKFYDEPPEEFDGIVVRWDTASTLKENSAWSAGTVWGVANHQIYLLHVERERLDAVDLHARIEAIHKRFRADVTIIEETDHSRSIAQHMYRNPRRICWPILIPVRIDKVARMQGRSMMFETGQIWLPMQAPWLDTYVHELLGFPNVQYADQVDSTSQALSYIQRRFYDDLASEPEVSAQGQQAPTRQAATEYPTAGKRRAAQSLIKIELEIGTNSPRAERRGSATASVRSCGWLGNRPPVHISRTTSDAKRHAI